MKMTTITSHKTISIVVSSQTNCMDNLGSNCVKIEAWDSSVYTSDSMSDDIGNYIFRLTQTNMKMVVSSYNY